MTNNFHIKTPAALETNLETNVNIQENQRFHFRMKINIKLPGVMKPGGFWVAGRIPGG